MSGHTPGPWTVHKSPPGECQLAEGHYVDGADGKGVAFAGRSTADARLIAAAPEMYEMLALLWRHIPEDLVIGFDPEKPVEGQYAWQQVKALLAKARGEAGQ